LIDLHAPFDCTVKIDPQATSDAGTKNLQDQLPGILSSFGTRHVNLIAHSKGGLFARGFLQLNANVDPIAQIGVVSVTTLDTPHRGSVLASTVAHFNSAPLSAAFIKFAQNHGFSLSFVERGANDMTPNGLAGFNQKNPTPPPQFSLADAAGNIFTTNPQYYSTSADADQDSNGKISDAEANPPYSQLFGNLAYQVIARNQPVTTLTQLGLLALSSAPTSSTYFFNDCLVPIYSTRYPEFVEIGSFQGAIGRNHGTVRKPDIAALVFTKIQAAESMQP
jgi:triacylglycerol esterase/lipase EstA (alpha/beta hydrolase family)